MGKIIAEIKAGIDPTTTNLVGGPGEYWLADEQGDIRLTGSAEVLINNIWTRDANGDYRLSGDPTDTSENWEVDVSDDIRLK